MASSGSSRKKVIIDTDPGIVLAESSLVEGQILDELKALGHLHVTAMRGEDVIRNDAMAICMAFQSPELEVIGLTTIFGNVHTALATLNALYLCEVGGHSHVPVAEGSTGPMRGGIPEIADFCHGSDGLGNTNIAEANRKKIDQSAVEFLIEMVSKYPGEISIVALGPLTNVAHAIQKDPLFAKNIGQLVVLGGAFFSSGNINPAAESNIYSDPEAADIVFCTPGIDTFVIGINLTTQVIFTEEDLIEIKDSKGKHGKLLYDCTKFYKSWHMESDGLNELLQELLDLSGRMQSVLSEGIFLHDPTCMAVVIDPSLFTFHKGSVRVETLGICTGHTLLDFGIKKWTGENPWTNQPTLNVGWTVNAKGVQTLVKNILTRP